MLNLEVKEERHRSPPPLITFKLNMQKHIEGSLSIQYLVDDQDICSEGQVFHKIIETIKK